MKIASLKPAYIEKVEEHGDIQVWIVDGFCLRDVFDIEFTEGGHDYVYEFVPVNEIWIDDDLVEAEPVTH